MKKVELSKFLAVKFSDIKKIGHTSYGDEGKTHIVCDGNVYGVESILLRNILSIEGFHIISTEDDIWIDVNNITHYDVDIETDMPWNLYHRMLTD